ncbi:MAG: response regulator transcription factor [Lachnospiraceae bacterium]|nr:response regulator transcription factor [Lachnospiraceae bacterium]
MEYRNRILVVDDDDVLRKYLETVLSEQYEVFSAASGQAALDLLADMSRLDLILLDIEMPGMRGYELHERIKDLTVCHEVPVIYLTGLTHPDEEIKGLGLGAADFVTKPCAKDVLLARVESRLRSAKRLDMKKLSALPEMLTDTELNVLQRAALSMTNEEIAEHMGYTYGYVKFVVSQCMQKLGISNRRDVKLFLPE